MIQLTLNPNLKSTRFGLKRTALSLTDGHNCGKCSLKCEGAPIFRGAPIFPRVAKSRVVIIADHAFGERSPYTNSELKLISDAIRTINVDYIYHTCAVKCKHDKTPTKKMMEWCESRLREELELIRPTVIVCLGKGPATLFNLTGAIDRIKSGVYDVEGIKGCTPKLVITQPLDKVLSDNSFKSGFLSDFKKVEKFANPENIAQKTELKYSIFESPAEFSTWVDKLIANKDKFVVGADIETMGLDPFEEDARIRTISFSWAHGYGVCVPYELDPDGYFVPLKRLLESEVRFVFHNAVFDLSYIRVTLGIEVANLVADTMLMAYLLDPTRGVYGYGLKPLAQEWTDLGAYDTEVKDGDWKTVSLAILAPYNICDSDATLRLFKIFYKKLQELNMLRPNALMAQAVHVICDLQINGVLIDQEFVKETIPKLEELVAGYEKELESLAGRSCDWNSPKVLGKLMYEELGYSDPYGRGEQPTGDDALDRLNTAFTRTLRKYRKAFKLLSVYFKGYFSKVGRDGRLRARFNLTGTATGRLSSSEPNLQNLPRGMGEDDPGYEDLHDIKVKNTIVARPGWTLLAADQSQVELRVSAMVSMDREMLRVYREDIDMHSLNAMIAFDIVPPVERLPEDDDTSFLRRQLKWIKKNKPIERTAAKSISFGVLYGMTAKGLKFDLDGKTRNKGRIWEVEECQIFIDKFMAKFPELAQWIKKQQYFAKKYGYTYTLMGRRRWLPNINSKDYFDRVGEMRMAINTPIQSCASDIMILGIINIRKRIDPNRALLIATVHDSVVLEVREDYLEECKKILKECLENPLFNGKPLEFLHCPLLAEMEVGNKYGDMH